MLAFLVTAFLAKPYTAERLVRAVGSVIADN
jgi:hypothetical protein